MALPLYANARPRDNQLKNKHNGLWYSKFCNLWTDKWELGAQQKQDWIKEITTSFSGQREAIEETIVRLLRLVKSKNGRFGVLTAESRFVTGLGLNHPVENGFAWHHTLGVPYLAGSSIKGMLRAWVDQQNGIDKDLVINKIFGSKDGMGLIHVCDGLPAAPVKLEVDVMTPHYAGWLPNDPPGDWRSPVPIPFLVTAAGTSFVFSLIPRNIMANDIVDQAWTWLIEALEWIGIGAKTSVGYGRFQFDEDATEKLNQKLGAELSREREQNEESDADTPVGRWRRQIKGLKEQKILDLALTQLERGELKDKAERRGLAEAIAETGLLEWWRAGRPRDQDTKTGSAKLKARAKVIDAELQ